MIWNVRNKSRFACMLSSSFICLVWQDAMQVLLGINEIYRCMSLPWPVPKKNERASCLNNSIRLVAWISPLLFYSSSRISFWVMPSTHSQRVVFQLCRVLQRVWTFNFIWQCWYCCLVSSRLNKHLTTWLTRVLNHSVLM